MSQLLNIRILTPKRVLFEGPALSVSSTNSEGRFDILPEHANFITIIQKQRIDIQKPDHRELVFNFNQAIIYNYKNYVSIYAEPVFET